MAPPTGSEQLIRDYLNRLSVAARDLAPDDRRALLERTRSLIEQKADLARRPTTMDVGRVLARLGDPARLVEQERRRLATQGRSPRPSTPDPSDAPSTPARQRFLARALGREHGRLRGPSFGRPFQPDSRSSPSVAAPNGVVSGVDMPAGADGPPQAGSPSSANGTAHGTAVLSGGESARPERPVVAQPRSGAGSAAEQPLADAAPGASGTAGERRDTVPPAEAAAAGPTASADESTTAADAMPADSEGDAAEARPEVHQWRRPRTAALRGPVGRQVSRLLAWARKRPLEAAAIVVMGIGGPIFPPVFLIGATLALASELWDGRDKWVGLALPVVLTVIGLAVGVAAGGRAHWMHESWVYLDVVSRVAPALGAGYLAWRCQRPRRQSPVPPFSRPYRAS
jgi:hypothetical protein